MRILQIRFSNLNSLVGEWTIDFTHPEYTADGLFVIAGPTGAGKSTILDALCLALYGCTPRLGKLSKSSNEIMSRHTGACFAEATFETQAGCFRSHWSQHRARRQPDGELQAPRHEITEAESGKVLETKIQAVAKRMEAVTGMDFDRFTRSMMLAQGSFAAFLQADPDERAPILEQITGTGIYSQISIKVHERNRELHEQLNRLEAEMAGISVLTAEEETTFKKNLTGMQKQTDKLSGALQQAEKALDWLIGIDGLNVEIQALSVSLEQLNAEMTTFKPQRDRLRRALAAAQFDGNYATLCAVRKQRDEDRRQLEKEQAQVDGLTERVRQQQSALQQAEQSTLRAKSEQQRGAPLIQHMRELDQQLRTQEKAIASDDVQCRKTAEQIAECKKNLLTQQQQLDAVRSDLKRLQDYQHAHRQDEALIADFAAIETQLMHLTALQQDFSAQQKSREALQLESAQTDQTATRQSADLAASRQALQRLQQQIGDRQYTLKTVLNKRLLREYRTEKESLLRELALLNTIVNLQQQRRRLADGKPCPLCGSTDHPYAVGNVPQADAVEEKIGALTAVIEKAEALESEIGELENSAKQALNAVGEVEKALIATQQAQQNIARQLSAATAVVDTSRERLTGLQQTVQLQLTPYGIEELTSDARQQVVDPILESLKQRLQNWQEAAKNKLRAEQRMNELDSELKKQNAVIETQSQGLAEYEAALAAKRQAFDALQRERQRLYGDRQPDSEAAQLEQAVTAAEQAEKSMRQGEHDARQHLNTVNTQIKSLQQRIENHQVQLYKLEPDFLRALQAAGFDTEDDFSACRLPPAQSAALQAQVKAMDDRQFDLLARKKDREQRLEVERGKQLTAADKTAMTQEIEVLRNQSNQLRDQIAEVKHRLQDNQAAREKMHNKLTQIAAQKRLCRRWGILHELIGSADGKKFRNFAQGLTFEMMIGQANRQLQKLTERYLLIRDEKKPLELSVIDSYQAGEIRSTKNLSGGENFIVSLALALGLSHMASRNMRIDSLFLDEGFGTLDDDALDIALDMLSNLQQDGKLIGVISHVAMLKSRISTQIEVIPHTGGRSRLAGPGVIGRD